MQTKAATLSVAQVLAELAKSTLLPDINRIKEATIRRIEADTDAHIADAKKKLAEATEASNRATLHKRKDAITQAEQDLKRIEVAKGEAEVDAIRKDAETRRIQAVADAQTKFLEALSRLRQDGGEVFVNGKNLEAVIAKMPRLEDSSIDTEAAQEEWRPPNLHRSLSPPPRNPDMILVRSLSPPQCLWHRLSL